MRSVGGAGAAMEMTTKRLAGLTVAGFALLVIARPPRPTGTPWDARSQDTRASERVARQRTASLDTLHQLDGAVRARHLRDSVSHAVSSLSPGGRNQLIADPRIPLSLRQHMQQVYADTRRQMGGAWALPIFVVLDTSMSYFTSSVWIDDLQLGEPLCATVVGIRVGRGELAPGHVPIRTLTRALGANFPQRRHFGLCSFEATFGVPSAVVRQGMREREFVAIGSGFDIALQPRAFINRFYADAGIMASLNYFPWWDSGENGRRVVALRACGAGRLSWCGDAVAPKAEGGVAKAVEVTTNWTRFSWWGWHGSPDLMNALAQALGPQKFGELWKANATPLESYRRLTGVAADTLSRRLLVGEAPMRLGAMPTLWEAFAAFVVAALFAGLSLLSHPRRRH
jgi:hypothetical protein